MSNASQPFDFSQFVPGFDFLKNLAGGAAGGSGGGAVPGLPGLASWVAPTLSVEEVDKRIQELKTVQYWLEQNGHALKATIQALEVQKMTLSTLRGMNVRMEDIANAFTKQAAAVAPAAAPVEPEPEAEPEEEAPAEAAAPARKARSKPASSTGTSTGNGGVVDPMQWWGSLTEQFQQIASSALQDAAQLKVPAMAQPVVDAVDKAMGKPAASAASKPAAKKAAATPAAKKKAPGAARKRTASRR
ncbi:PhaM family polyhydroxyalkanoate granule multifunctional regulatory protein [Variovorax paradoxus]|uniref:PhaM family polyhydroxyalkanoate granule multifunctional regulatory protein n=1 Tax=Variovorax paradoxus TaxID=34073 RepID=UPI00278A9ADE|nr:PhaM family polyhydroxyalkanoate granule multifunctional regulatory protein [Variovorax paradoxus]MDP9932679.1 ribosomal protein L12E/L44/L45/RPP1/RPP2 [Variovorax paradoxus]